MKLSPWKTKMVELGSEYFTVCYYNNKPALLCVLDEDYNGNDEDGWVDVSDLSEMRIWEYEKLNELLIENFGVRADVSGNLTREEL